MATKVSVNIRFSKTQSNIITFKNKRRRKCNLRNSHAAAKSFIGSSSIKRKCQRIDLLAKCIIDDAIVVNKTNKLQKHRWKLNQKRNERAAFSVHCMTACHNCGNRINTSQQQQQQQQHQCQQFNVERFLLPTSPSETPRAPQLHHKRIVVVATAATTTKAQRDADDADKRSRNMSSTGKPHQQQQRRRDFFHSTTTTYYYANCRKLFNWTTAGGDKFVKLLLPIFILVNMLPFLYAGESKL